MAYSGGKVARNKRQAPIADVAGTRNFGHADPKNVPHHPVKVQVGAAVTPTVARAVHLVFQARRNCCLLNKVESHMR